MSDQPAGRRAARQQPAIRPDADGYTVDNEVSGSRQAKGSWPRRERTRHAGSRTLAALPDGTVPGEGGGMMDHDGPQERAHLARIAKITRRFADGELSAEEKRAAIEAENRAYYGENLAGAKKQRRRFLKTHVPADSYENVLADQLGVPLKNTQVALEAGREASRWAADHAGHPEEAQVVADGQKVRDALLYGPRDQAPAQVRLAGETGDADGMAAAG
jgi:hypothetical protein